MRLVVSDAATELLEERDGRLFVWIEDGGCCGRGLKTLASSTEAPSAPEFRRVAVSGRLDVFLPVELARLPDELHLDARRFPRRIEAYWNGCAWVV